MTSADEPAAERLEVDVCIVGGGPAGVLLGLLLSREGVRVVVLEQHRDFAREYRGELLMPRFSQVLRQVGLFGEVTRLPHTKLEALEMYSGRRLIGRVPLSEVDPVTPYAIWMSQPVLLAGLSALAAVHPGYLIRFGASVQRLRLDGDVVRGVLAKTPDGALEVEARVTVGADGRASAVRRLGGFRFAYERHDFDVLWFTLPRPATYGSAFRLYYSPERSYVVSPKHPDLLQCGLLAQPSEFPPGATRLDSIRAALRSGPEFLHGFAERLSSVSELFRLPASLSLVERWSREGLLLIGDAAHTCSPVGAVGVSVAAGTAAVAAGVVLDSLSSGDVSERSLSRVQTAREVELRRIQRIQRLFANVILTRSRALRGILPAAIPLIARTGLPQLLHRRLVVSKRPLALGPPVARL